MKKTAKSQSPLKIEVGDIRGNVRVVEILESYHVTESEASDRDVEPGYFVTYEGEEVPNSQPDEKAIRKAARWARSIAADDFSYRDTDEYRAAIAAEKALG